MKSRPTMAPFMVRLRVETAAICPWKYPPRDSPPNVIMGWAVLFTAPYASTPIATICFSKLHTIESQLFSHFLPSERKGGGLNSPAFCCQEIQFNCSAFFQNSCFKHTKKKVPIQTRCDYCDYSLMKHQSLFFVNLTIGLVLLQVEDTGTKTAW